MGKIKHQNKNKLKNTKNKIVWSVLILVGLWSFSANNVDMFLVPSKKKKKVPTYLPTSKNLSRFTANKQFFKDGLF